MPPAGVVPPVAAGAAPAVPPAAPPPPGLAAARPFTHAETLYLRMVVQGVVAYSSPTTVLEWEGHMRALDKKDLVKIHVKLGLGAKSVVNRHQQAKLSTDLIAHVKKELQL